MFKKKELFIVFLLIAIFVFLRVYRIQESLLFFNDIGRDFLVLFKWNQSGKPPLLGPQTSALPFNQSAFYFYLLYPFYLITGHSPYASLLALIVFYLFFFIGGIYFLRKNKKLRYSLYFVFFLLSVHPQYIKQARFVWNPSFVTPFLLTAFYSFIYLKNNFDKKKSLDGKLTFLFALSISAATSFSYSVAPLFISFFLLSIFLFKKEIWKIILSLGSSLAFLNITTIFFELRHHFPLTKMLFSRQETSQLSSSILDRILDLNQYALSLKPVWGLIFLLVLIGVLVFYLNRNKDQELKIASLLLLLTIIISMIVPIKIHSHYVFGFLSLFFLIISFLNYQQAILFLVFLLMIWVNPNQINSYFQTSIRTIKESETCAQSFCDTHSAPIVISGQSSYLPSHHNAMEWQYFLSEAGCSVKDLTTEVEQVNNMAVVIDDSNYSHGKTAFNELTIFGESEEIEEFVCSDKLKIYYLEKTK